MGKEESIEFMLFVYFKITSKDELDSILNKIIEKAYKDATNQGAFNTLIQVRNYNDKKECTNVRTRVNNCYDEAKKKVLVAVKSFNCSNYKCWHNSICANLEKLYCENNIYYLENKKKTMAWTYGNSQKLVNMSIKYLLLVSNLFKEIEPKHSIVNVAEKYINIIEQIDLPIDNYILDAFSQDTTMWNDIHKDLPYTKNLHKRSNIKCWSKWNHDDYIKFRNSYHKYFSESVSISPIKWEHKKWISTYIKKNKQ